jgi:transposase InsO family protein
MSRHTWATREILRCALVDYIDGWYNPELRRSTLGYLSPTTF